MKAKGKFLFIYLFKSNSVRLGMQRGSITVSSRPSGLPHNGLYVGVGIEGQAGQRQQERSHDEAVARSSRPGQ
jgi:hypothetical protein